MDDQLKTKLAASLDLPTDSAADPDVARALEIDPEARDFARGLHTIERALQRWPSRPRADAEWSRLAARTDAKIEEAAREKANAKKNKRVSRDEADPAAVPVFEDDTPQKTESMQVMSEPQSNDDDDLENLAALTRTSTVPTGAAVPSVRPSMASISDAVDDTSSGIVDIKTLAAMARDAPATPAEAPAAKTDEKIVEKANAKPDAKPGDKKAGAKKDDVMVTPARAAVPAATTEPPRKSGALWGAIGGMALMAGAFVIYNNMSHTSPEEGASAPPAAEVAPSGSTAVPEAQSAPTMPAPVVAPSPAPQPMAPPPSADPSGTGAPTTATLVPAQVAAAPTPTTVAVAAPEAPADQRPARERVVARDENAAAHRAPATRGAAAHAAASAPAEHPAPAAAPPAPAAPAAAPAPAAARPAAQTAAPAAHSVDDLMNRVAGANAPAQPAHAAAAETTAELPERLTRAQVTGVLAALAGAVRSCTNGQTGTAPVTIVISNDGTVSSANVSGQFAGSAAGECIAGVVRRAHFQRFRAPEVRLTYPFVVLPPH